MPARAAVVVGASFAPGPSIAPVTRTLAPEPYVDPFAPTVVGAAPVPPPPPSAPAYERAFRRWSQPSFDLDAERGAEGLTFQVYTSDALPSPPRVPSGVAFAPAPQPASMLVRAAAVVLGVAVLVGTGLVGVAAATDDAPGEDSLATAPPSVATTPPIGAMAIAPPSVVGLPPAASTVIELDDEAAAPRAKAPDNAAAGTASGKGSRPSAGTTVDVGASLPPNPYGR